MVVVVGQDSSLERIGKVLDTGRGIVKVEMGRYLAFLVGFLGRVVGRQ